MTCRQLGGACNAEFTAETFEEISKMSQSHAKEMFAAGDEAHLNAMKEMQQIMQKPGAMEEWMQRKREEFNA